MNLLKIYILSGIAFLCAILCFALYNQIIIIKIPSYNDVTYSDTSSFYKKEIIISYFHHEKWNNEKQELLWSDNITHNSYQLINALLTVLNEERVTTKKIIVQSALISSDATLYLSFDDNPLSKKDSIFLKWMFVEGLLKTLRENNIPIQKIQLLVQHQPLIDYHLDFSMSWPIGGFIKQQ